MNIRKLFAISLMLLMAGQMNAQSIERTKPSAGLQVIYSGRPPLTRQAMNRARVDFYAKIFEAEGIEYASAESAPGRGNIWARLKGG